MESLRLTRPPSLSHTGRPSTTPGFLGERHGAMTGGAATSDPQKGGTFTAWDEYISGKISGARTGQEVLPSGLAHDRVSRATAPDSRARGQVRQATPEGTRPDDPSKRHPGWSGRDVRGRLATGLLRSDERLLRPEGFRRFVEGENRCSRRHEEEGPCSRGKEEARPRPPRKKSVAKAAKPKAKASEEGSARDGRQEEENEKYSGDEQSSTEVSARSETLESCCAINLRSRRRSGTPACRSSTSPCSRYERPHRRARCRNRLPAPGRPLYRAAGRT